LFRLRATDLFDISWEGKVALVYAGDHEPKYRFRAEITGVPFPVASETAEGGHGG